jgi:hypothetical protein
MKTNYTVNIFLNPTSPDEIGKIINKLKNCSVGWDNFPASILKENSTSLSELLSHFVNISIKEGVFPNELKIGNIIPLYKAGPEGLVGNYHPVSLLSTFSKVFEKVFYFRLLNFLKAQNVLYLSQFGFREKHSTYMAILTLLEHIIKAVDKGQFAIGIFYRFC